jgi:hypothetical protein
MSDSFDPGRLRAVAAAFDEAGSRVAELAATFGGSAGAPGSPSVIGSAPAAAGYAQGMAGCLRGLAQLRVTLASMAQDASVAAAHYERTESANVQAVSSVRAVDAVRPSR